MLHKVFIYIYFNHIGALSSSFSLSNISVSGAVDTLKTGASSAMETAGSMLSSGVSAVKSGATKVVETGEKFGAAAVDIIKSIPNFNPKASFDSFMSKYGKSYPTTADMEKAFMNFLNNFKSMIGLLTSRRSPFDAAFGVTEFMDMVYSDFVKGFCGAEVPPEDVSNKTDAKPKHSCLRVNWTSLDVIPQVRRQEKCGCCYAMSTIDMIAAQYVIDKKLWHKRYSLAPQWMMNCLEAPVAMHCNGGRPVKVLDKVSHFTKWNNLPLETCLPYKDINETCIPSPKCPDAPPISVRDHVWLKSFIRYV